MRRPFGFRRALGRGALAFILGSAAGGLPAAADVPTAWQQLDDGDPSPAPLRGAFDAERNLPVLVWSGLGGGVGAITQWELVGDDWKRRRFPEPTPHIVGGCVAFDAGRNRLVIFGEGTAKDRTWEFDGTAWEERVFAVHPVGRIRCSMTYDSTASRIVMFGGYSTGLLGLGDTWEYDGTSWQQISGTGPTPRGEAGVAYDAGAGVTVLFGGRNGSVVYADTWEYDAVRNRWRNESPSTGPSARTGAGLAYDPVRDRTVLFGGLNVFGVVNDTWEYDGRTWQQRSPPVSPVARYNMVTMFDATRGKVLIWGGAEDNNNFNDTWTYDGATWERIAVSGLPGVRHDFAMEYSPEIDGLVLHGGEVSGGVVVYRDTWHYTGAVWTRQDPPVPPTAKGSFKLEHDPWLGGLLGFGGTDPIADLPEASDEHRYDPVAGTWTSTPGCCPDARMEHGWARADALGGFLMFGGDACCSGTGSLYFANDTWLRTPSGWTEIDPPNRPGGRTAVAMAWDSWRGRAVLYGGRTQLMTFAETWEFDGVDWVRRFATSPPGERYSAGLVFDPVRGVSVLFGAGSPMETVTWEYDGTGWTARPTPFLPDPSRAYFEMAWDPKREVIFVFGGQDLKSEHNFNDTWAYGADPDGDGNVGKLDNCVSTSNADQSNGDGDAAGDVCDCAPSDSSAWGAPVPVTGLTASGSGTTTIVWADQSGSVGSGVMYDVASGDLAALRSGSWSGASCLASQTALPSATDTRIPEPGSGYWYLTRSRNACGIGTYGRAGLDGASPCP